MPDRSFWKNKRVLVSGATGFKGSWLCLWLNQLGADVHGFGLPAPSEGAFRDMALDQIIPVHHLDLANQAAVVDLISSVQPEVIFHLAAQPIVSEGYADPVSTLTTNVMGTMNMLEAARQLNKLRVFVNITTDKVYRDEDNRSGYIEADHLGGADPYSASKVCADIIGTCYYTSFFAHKNVAVSNVRAGNVLGGGDSAVNRIVPDFFRAIRAQQPLAIRSPKAVRPWQHVMDPLCGYLMLAEKMFSEPLTFSGSWNFGPGQTNCQPVETLLSELSSAVSQPPQITYTEKEFKETNFLFLNSQKARETLGWQARLSLPEAAELICEIESARLNDKVCGSLYREQIQAYMK